MVCSIVISYQTFLVCKRYAKQSASILSDPLFVQTNGCQPSTMKLSWDSLQMYIFLSLISDLLKQNHWGWKLAIPEQSPKAFLQF